MLKKGLKTKFVLYLIPLVIFISLSFLLFFLNRANSLIRQQLTQVGFSLARSLSYSSEAGVATEDVMFLRPYFEKVFQEENIVLVAVYNKEGRPILLNKKIQVEDGISVKTMDSITAKGSVIKTSGYSQGQEFYDFYAPVYIGGALKFQEEEERELAGFARVGLSLAGITYQTRIILIIGLSITVLISVLGTFVSFFIASRLVKPIKQLEQGAKVFAKGDFGYRIKIKTGDEIEDLAIAFNQMAQALGRSRQALEESKDVLGIKVKARTRELQELTEKLEEKVGERTKQLQQRVNELERFYRLTVGRELKMIELKKELRGLKEELGKTGRDSGSLAEHPLTRPVLSKKSLKKTKGRSKKSTG